MSATWFDGVSETVRQASSGTVELGFDGPVAELVLSRPDKLNAISGDVLHGIRATFEAVAERAEVRAVIVRGAGRCFSAGGDLAEVRELTAEPARFSEFLDFWHGALDLVERSPLPTIAAVHGLAFAGGLELMQACDLAVVGDKTRIGDQHAMFGLFPAGGSTQRLPRLIGPRAAAWLLMTGEEISAVQAVELGLANEVVPEDQVRDRALQMGQLLATKSRAGTSAIKQALREGADRPLEEAIRLERPIAVGHMASTDAQHGFSAFAARAKPDFTR